MDVIGHQAICADPDPLLCAFTSQKLEKIFEVLMIKKNFLTVVAALNGMMREVGKDETSFSRHRNVFTTQPLSSKYLAVSYPQINRCDPFLPFYPLAILKSIPFKIK